MKTKLQKLSILIVVSLLSSVLLSGCFSAETHSYDMAGHNVLSNEIRMAAPQSQDAYRIAIANPDILAQYPCYCGCGPLGHVNNLDCYIVDMQDETNITFDTHALYCNICIDITFDVMRFLDEGLSPEEIGIRIDEIYSVFGPSNMEPSS